MSPLLMIHMVSHAAPSTDGGWSDWSQEVSVQPSDVQAAHTRRPYSQTLSTSAFTAVAGDLDESGGADVAWTFEALSKASTRHYPSVTASLRQLDAARSDRRAAAWERFPTPGLQANSDDDITQGVLSLEQPLWSGGRITAGIEAADARLEASREQVDEVRQDILQRVIDAFAEAQRSTAQLEIAEQSVEEFRELQQMIDRRVRQKASPQADLDLASSRLSQAIAERTAIAQSLRTSLARLTELSGKTVGAVALSDEGEALDVNADLDAAQQEAQRHSPRLAQLGFQQQAARADTRAEKSAIFPTLALRLEQSESRGGGIAASERSDTRLLMVMESDFGAGLSTAASIESASSREQSLLQERQAAIRELRSEVADFWHQRESARLRMESAEQTLRSAERVSASYTRQYAIGQKSWLDLMNAVREASSAGLAVEEARAEIFRTSWRLAALTGSAA